MGKFDWKLGLLMGSIFAFVQTLGNFVAQSQTGYLVNGSEDVWNFLTSFLQTGIWSVLLFIFLYWVLEKGNLKIEEKRSRGHFWKNWLMLLPLYIVCFLAYFPGSVSYDASYITWQALRIIGFDNHHPFLHTLLWTIFLAMEEKIGIQYLGVVLFTVLQLLFMTGVYAYILTWMEKRVIRTWQRTICMIYYIFNPVLQIFSLIIVKDVLFAGCFLLFQLFLIDFWEAFRREENLKKPAVRISIMALLCCLFRNNMIYVILVYFVVVLVLYKKRAIILSKYISIAILVFYLLTEVVYPSVGVLKGSIKEMLSVPMSQIAAVYQFEPEKITEQEEALIRKYIPDVEGYDCYFADRIKQNFNGDAVRENPQEFLQLWMELFEKSEGVYVRAFLALNLPYWYTDMESVKEYIETDNYSGDYFIERTNWLPGAFEFYENVADKEAAFMNLPILKLLFSISMPIWIWLFFVLSMLKKGQKQKVVAILPGLLLWMTYLLGPVSNFRYIAPLIMAWPIWFILAVSGKEKGEGI